MTGMERDIFFLTSLGIAEYPELTYGFRGQRHSTRFAPVATAALVFDAAERERMLVRVLCTAKARATRFDRIAEEFVALGVRGTEWCEVPEVQSERDMEQVLSTILKIVPEDHPSEVAVDVTFGFRHLPFLYTAALTYLVGLREAQFRGMFYSARELEGLDGTHPILDLSRFFELVRWYQALTALRDTGRARPLAAILRQHVSKLFSAAGSIQQHFKQVSVIRDAAEKLAVPLSSGLPIEAGFEAQKLIQAVAAVTILAEDAAILAARELAKVVRVWSLPPEIKRKEELPLTKEELERQWQFTRWLFEHDDYTNCLEALREWVVNLVLYRQGITRDWLHHERSRRPAERFLAALAYRTRTPGAHALTQTQQLLASFWSKISEKRNLLAHAGMKSQTPLPTRDELRQLVIHDGRQLLDTVEKLNVHFGGSQKLLVSGLGRSPGALFTALSHVRPDALLVLTSAEASRHLKDTLQAAGLPDLPVHPIILADPYRAFRQIKRVLDVCRPVLLDADRVIVNLTGGTTAMQYLCERVGDEATKLGIDVQRVAAIDEPPREEQYADPFKLGTLELLDVEVAKVDTAGSASTFTTSPNHHNEPAET